MCNKPNTEMLRFAAEKGFIHETAKWENGKTNLKSASLKARSLGYLWDKAEAWGV